MSKLFRLVLWGAGGIGSLAGLVLLAFSVVASPLYGLLGLIVSLLYVAGVLWALSRLPIWPHSPAGLKSRWWVVSALIWGAGATMLFVAPIGFAISDLAFRTGSTNAAAAWGGAYPEEIAKMVGVIVICLSFSQLNRPWHGLVVGAVIGLGFEAVENITYGAMGAMLDANSDWAGFWFTSGLRLVAGPCLHILFTALAGWGVGLALFTANKSARWRWGHVLGWLFVAFALHFGWNYQFNNDFLTIGSMVAVALVLYPLAGIVIVRACRQAGATPPVLITAGLPEAKGQPV
ncbi:MAG: PrsW family intramembrane metalloprotease [Corynebacterium sp.]|nr:PrsW family intramembrane metalloprotease [Corynebacterium sp.]